MSEILYYITTSFAILLFILIIYSCLKVMVKSCSCYYRENKKKEDKIEMVENV